ncbi:MAG: ribonuclease HII [Pyrinomonadaceae bacterium]|nr:ribonuclease HII [Pyrinomonadaceae bacterium]
MNADSDGFSRLILTCADSSIRIHPYSFYMAVGIDFEQKAIAEGFRFVAGVDEVGRGCLAGAVVAAAVVLDLSKPIPVGLNDSKKISAKNRVRLDAEIRANAICYAVGQIEADEIDRINILQATKKAMISAIGQLVPAADFLLIDALQLKELATPQKAIIHGDAISASIAAASIIAKTYRDNLMAELDVIYPEYGFAKHVGYGTKAHFEAIRKHGACLLHRKSFRGVL